MTTSPDWTFFAAVDDLDYRAVLALMRVGFGRLESYTRAEGWHRVHDVDEAAGHPWLAVWLTPGQMLHLIDQIGRATWPITETTYVLFERQPTNEARTKLALRFFYWAFQQGDAMARGTGFIPLPTHIQARAVKMFSEIHDHQDAPLNFF